jgi:branched-chain amino acid aminotransferase
VNATPGIGSGQFAISWLWNGRDFEPCDFIPLSDRGFRYGMSVFESIRVWKNTPLFFREHAVRLREACARCELRVSDTALDRSEKLLRECGIDGLARIYVTAGDGAVASDAGQCRMVVFVEARAPIPADVYDRGYALAIEAQTHTLLFGGLKTANYWTNADALRRAKRNLCDEALLFNAGGELISACMANVFAVVDGRLKTPAMACGARAGVVRKWVAQRRGDAIECRITSDELARASEVFLTSSWLGIMPVASLEDRRLPSNLIAADFRTKYDSELPG